MQGTMRNRKNGVPGSLILLAAAAFCLSACQQEYHPVEPPVVKVPTTKQTLVATADVYQGQELVGHLRTFRLEDEGGVQVTRVYDLRDEHIGYITEDGRAFRRSAHGGHDLVANSSTQSKNVAAIFGRPLERMTIKVLASVN